VGASFDLRIYVAVTSPYPWNRGVTRSLTVRGVRFNMTGSIVIYFIEEVSTIFFVDLQFHGRELGKGF